VLQELLENAKQNNIRMLRGTYVPTDRNKLVIDHYRNLGFIETDRFSDGTTSWELCVETAPKIIVPISVRRIRFASPAAVGA
jgi:predicted enzyme involved in methoxymalonyl-ACP biosynthesis